MPCSDNGEREAMIAYFKDEKIKVIRSKLKNARIEIRKLEIEELSLGLEDALSRNDLLARLLCYLTNMLDPIDIVSICKNNFEFSEWWKEHQEFDKNRKE